MEEKSGIDVVGVAPYLQIDIEDEDSLSERLDFRGNGDTAALIDIAVIRLPRISNFTDLNVMETIPGVSVRYVKNAQELKDPDMIVLPGSKNTISDLLWMRQNGLEAAILKQAGIGKVVFGICGGFQMLGETLADPLGIETSGEVRGMGLLPIDTVFLDEKTRTRVTGSFLTGDTIFDSLKDQKLEAEGYEIHMGQSTLKAGAKHLLSLTDAVTGQTKQDGAYKENVFGSYVHGIFDGAGIARTVIQALAEKKGVQMGDIGSMTYAEYKETQYDLLAASLRKYLNMEKIYRILETGIDE